MDSSKNPDNNEKSVPVDTPAGSRLRNDSECSGASDDGLDRGRRMCVSPQFMIPGATSASPPKFVTLEEIMHAANGIRDMALVHQIVVDQDFKLAPAELPEDSVQRRVRDTMHQAFWDLLGEQLAQRPPDYGQALVLLEDIKKGLNSLLLPQHTKIRQQIGEVLDSDLIRQQAQNGVLDFPRYAQYIISVMAKLCAPVRDERIKELARITDVVDTFKGILETLDLMALDMANFAIEIARPEIIAHSIDYERKKFADYLSVQPDGLEHTRHWLLRHLPAGSEAPPPQDRVMAVRNLTVRTLAEAYVQLLDWDAADHFPETLAIDEQRLRDLRERTHRLVLVATVMLVTGSLVGSSLQALASFKEGLKHHLCVLLQTVTLDSRLDDLLPNVAEQVVQDVRDGLAQLQLPPLAEDAERALKTQVLDVSRPDHRIRDLVRQRVREFLLQIITSPTAAPQQVPSGLGLLQRELAGVAGQFLRVVSHNRAVFSQYYLDIVERALPVA